MIDVSAPNYPQDEANGVTDMNTVYHQVSVYAPDIAVEFLSHRIMQEIIPGVFLGSFTAAQKHCLLENEIRYIVCVRQDGEAHFIKPQISDPNFTYLTLNIADNATENIIRFITCRNLRAVNKQRKCDLITQKKRRYHVMLDGTFFPKVRQFIDEALSNNCKVLVHGNNGNSRSATLVLAYIMEKFGLSSSEALEYVKEKRASVNPNEGFRAQLEEYEPIYKARQILANGESSSDCRQKRKCEQLTETVDYNVIQRPPSPDLDNNNQEYPQSDAEFSNHLHRLWLLKRS